MTRSPLTKLEFLHGRDVFVLKGSQDGQRLGTAGRSPGRLSHLPLWRGREGRVKREREREGLREREREREYNSSSLAIKSHAFDHLWAEECDAFTFERGR